MNHKILVPAFLVLSTLTLGGCVQKDQIKTTILDKTQEKADDIKNKVDTKIDEERQEIQVNKSQTEEELLDLLNQKVDSSLEESLNQIESELKQTF